MKRCQHGLPMLVDGWRRKTRWHGVLEIDAMTMVTMRMETRMAMNHGMEGKMDRLRLSRQIQMQRVTLLTLKMTPTTVTPMTAITTPMNLRQRDSVASHLLISSTFPPILTTLRTIILTIFLPPYLSLPKDDFFPHHPWQHPTTMRGWTITVTILQILPRLHIHIFLRTFPSLTSLIFRLIDLTILPCLQESHTYPTISVSMTVVLLPSRPQPSHAFGQSPTWQHNHNQRQNNNKESQGTTLKPNTNTHKSMATTAASTSNRDTG